MDIVGQEALYPPRKMPIGMRWRSSYWFTTFVVGSGIGVDLLVYSLVIPVVPFQLERLGYDSVSALTGWLLFAYSGGLLTATMPAAMLSEGYHDRRWPLIIGLVVLIGSQIMFMEAPSYAVMCIARVIQGVASSIVWVVGLALLCDATPEHLVGQQLGIVMSGLSVGLVLGPPIGGALYNRFGFRGPFIFGIIFCLVDALGRLVIIERKDSLKWGYDPHNPSDSDVSTTPGEDLERPTDDSSAVAEPIRSLSEKDTNTVASPNTKTEKEGEHSPAKPLSLLAVFSILSKSSRAMAACVTSLIYGFIVGCQETSIPIHLQEVWSLTSNKPLLSRPSSAGSYPQFELTYIPASPITGYLTDKRGVKWVTLGSLGLSLPWLVVMMIEGRLALFVSSFGLSSFFASGVISPVSAELAAVSRSIEGLGYAHVYGVFNMAYGAGSTVGPVVGGQLYAHLKHGWQGIALLSAGLVGLGMIISFCFIGERT